MHHTGELGGLNLSARRVCYLLARKIRPDRSDQCIQGPADRTLRFRSMERLKHDLGNFLIFVAGRKAEGFTSTGEASAMHINRQFLL